MPTSRRSPSALLAILAAVALAGCASTGKAPDPNVARAYDAHEAYTDQVQAERAAVRAEVSKAAEACPKCGPNDNVCAALATMCATGVAREVSFAAGSGAGQAALTPPPAYRAPESGWVTFAKGTGEILRAVTPLAGIYQSDRANQRLADVQIRQAELQSAEEIAETNAWAGTAGTVAGVIGNLPPTYSVGGNFVGGSITGEGAGIGNTYTDASTTAGRDVLTDSQIGDAVGRDQVGGDQYQGDFQTGTGNRIESDGRNESPGPFDCDSAGDTTDETINCGSDGG